jgi:3-hydroxyacyl-CoA dehydrogenase/enoyl-CoA hydratase/3-hydroxybutyryl-CoA epimerase
MDAFRSELRGEVLVLTLDIPGESVNTLSPPLIDAFEEELRRVEQDDAVKAIVLTSGKPDFLVGADVKWLDTLRTAEEGEKASRAGHEALDRLALSRKPVVAAIHGSCLGGGLEWALACRGRVASDSSRTQLGLPEVQLGLSPGAGGTQRLPRPIGVQAALDIILPGSRCGPRGAEARAGRRGGAGLDPGRRRRGARAGVVAGDHLVVHSERSAREAVTHAALESNPLGRKLLFAEAKKQLLRKTGGHYPAPERALDAVREGIEHGIEAGFQAEARAFGELLTTDVSHRLRELFFATNALKKDSGVDGGADSRKVRLCVPGGGLMAPAPPCQHRAGQLLVRIRAGRRPVGKALASVRGLFDACLRRRRERRGAD